MIVVFGSLNVDLVAEIDVAPRAGQTLIARGFRIEAGGKGANQAVAAARAGAQVMMAGAVGNDPFAEAALSGLRDNAVDLSLVRTADAPTGCATIWIESNGANRIVVASGANQWARASEITDATLAAASSVLVQMEVAPGEVEAIVRRCRLLGTRSILNLAPALPLAPSVLASCGMLVVNQEEAEAVAGWLDCQPDAVSLRAALGTDVVRTLGGEGSEAATAEGICRAVPARVPVVDTTAAGDCYIGVLAAALDRGSDLPSALAEASLAASLACSRKGSQASLPSRTEIDEARAPGRVLPGGTP